MAHSLKGVSANIGAIEIVPLAENLELSLRELQSPELINSCVIALKKILENLLAELDLKLPKNKINKVVTVDPVQLKKICSQLATSLEAGDAEAVDIVNINIDLLSSAFPLDFQN
jgi:HPt (histidine-containing phosphotransfer) domain-containing protein